MLHFCRSLEHISWVVAINSSEGLASILWLIHYLGMFLVVGSFVFLDLRVLGLAGRKQGIAQLGGHLLPWAWTGFALVLPTGFVMFAGQATIFYPAAVFWIKIAVLALAVTFGVIVQANVPRWGRSPALPWSAKFLALVSLLLWVGAILASLEVPAFLPI